MLLAPIAMHCLSLTTIGLLELLHLQAEWQHPPRGWCCRATSAHLLCDGQLPLQEMCTGASERV